MRLLKQPNRWSCIPTSYAMVLGLDTETILKVIGHDGSNIIDPDLEEPFNRRGFHIQELIDVVLKFNKADVCIESLPELINYNNNEFNGHCSVYTIIEASKRLEHYLKNYSGVLLGKTLTDKPHAVAWNNESAKIYDPNYSVYTIDEFRIQEFHVIIKINNTIVNPLTN